MKIKFLLIILLAAAFTACSENKNDKSFEEDIYYEIWIKAFADSKDDNDNIGDISGIISRLDYLNDGDPDTDTDLGVTGIKISPFVECGLKTADPNANMHGYDATDFYAVNSLFGTEEEIKTLIAEAHKRGMKIIFDYVPNHTSDKHPWFMESKNKTGKRDWYVWDNNPDKAWEQPWGGGSWRDVWFPYEDSYYYSAFIFAGMPDLNFHNTAVRDEVIKVARYWIDMGFDGLRVDAARYLVEEGPGKAADTESSHKYYQEVRDVLNQYPDHKVMIAEAWTNQETIGDYYGNGTNEYDLAFDFPFVNAVMAANKRGDATELKEHFRYIAENYPGTKKTATFLSNHDAAASRPISEYKGDLNKVVLSAAVNILAGGVPFIYYGNEIGMEGKLAGGPHQDFQLRRHFNWDAARVQSGDPNSVLSWYRYLIKARKKVESLSRGVMAIPETGDSSVFAMVKHFENETALMLFNFSNREVSVKIDAEDIPGLSDNYGVVIGSPAVRVSQDGVRVGKLEATRFALITFGKTYDPVMGTPEILTGGAEPLEFTGFRYEKMFVRGTMNSYDNSIPMTNSDENVWSVETELEKGDYEFIFENSGLETRDIVYGDTDKNGVADFNGDPIEINISSKGEYRITFDFESLRYNVEKL